MTPSIFMYSREIRILPYCRKSLYKNVTGTTRLVITSTVNAMLKFYLEGRLDIEGVPKIKILILTPNIDTVLPIQFFDFNGLFSFTFTA